MIKLKKKYNVEFLGNEKRKIRSDVSPIGEYRYFLLNCLRRDVPRRIILKVLQDNDERFGDYTLARLNLYCSRMFKRTPIDKVSKSFKGIIVKSILFMMCLSFGSPRGELLQQYWKNREPAYFYERWLLYKYE